MDNTKINKIMNTAWVRKAMTEFMSQRTHTKSYISQDATEVYEGEELDCVTILTNKAQEIEFKHFSIVLSERPDIRAGYILIEDIKPIKV